MWEKVEKANEYRVGIIPRDTVLGTGKYNGTDLEATLTELDPSKEYKGTFSVNRLFRRLDYLFSVCNCAEYGAWPSLGEAHVAAGRSESDSVSSFRKRTRFTRWSSRPKRRRNRKWRTSARPWRLSGIVGRLWRR